MPAVQIVKNAVRNGFSTQEIIDKVQSKVTYTNGNVPGIPYIKKLIRLTRAQKPKSKKRVSSKKRSSKRRVSTRRRSSKAKSIKKVTPFRSYRIGRPSPNFSATLFPRGTRKMGGDGNIWQIIIASNGVRRWQKV
jgi:hypothetical protein